MEALLIGTEESKEEIVFFQSMVGSQDLRI